MVYRVIGSTGFKRGKGISRCTGTYKDLYTIQASIFAELHNQPYTDLYKEETIDFHTYTHTHVHDTLLVHCNEIYIGVYTYIRLIIL